jgi:hypothetical protein
MTVSLKHTFQSVKTDSLDVTLVQPSNWNQEHVLTAAAGVVLGRDTSGAGNVQELPISVTSAGNVTIPNNFAVTGTSGLTGNTTVTGTLGVTGTTTLTDLNATGTVGFTNALAVTSGGTGLATLYVKSTEALPNPPGSPKKTPTVTATTAPRQGASSRGYAPQKNKIIPFPTPTQRPLIAPPTKPTNPSNLTPNMSPPPGLEPDA